MKNTDYIVIQAPMITDLHLKGNALLLFALIHGFSKDGSSRFRGSLTYLSEWTGACRSSVNSTLKSLEKQGLITKHTAMVGALPVNEYSSNYDAVLEAMGVSVEPLLRNNDITLNAFQTSAENVLVQESDQFVKRTSNQSELVQKTDKTSAKNAQTSAKNAQTSAKNAPLISINKYNNYSFCNLSPEEQQEEQEQIFKSFFFRNARFPRVEAERFIAHNTANGWMNRDGREYDTAAKRAGLAGLWQFQMGDRRVSDDFLAFWKSLYSRAQQRFISGTDILLDESATVQQNEQTVVLVCKQPTADWIEANIPAIRDLFAGYLQGRSLSYKITH